MARAAWEAWARSEGAAAGAPGAEHPGVVAAAAGAVGTAGGAVGDVAGEAEVSAEKASAWMDGLERNQQA